MFQFVTKVFLGIKPFILNLPAETPSFVGQAQDRLDLHLEIADPLEAGGLHLTVDDLGF